jgi:hypothetical protein
MFVKKSRQFFGDGVDRGLLDSNPFRKVQAGSQVKRSGCVTSMWRRWRVIAAAPEARWPAGGSGAYRPVPLASLAAVGQMIPPKENRGRYRSNADKGAAASATNPSAANRRVIGKLHVVFSTLSTRDNSPGGAACSERRR